MGRRRLAALLGLPVAALGSPRPAAAASSCKLEERVGPWTVTASMTVYSPAGGGPKEVHTGASVTAGDSQQGVRFGVHYRVHPLGTEASPHGVSYFATDAPGRNDSPPGRMVFTTDNGLRFETDRVGVNASTLAIAYNDVRRVAEALERLPQARRLVVTIAPEGRPSVRRELRIEGFAAAAARVAPLVARVRAEPNPLSCPDESCFLTTACCDLLGLPDDCWELRVLRRFRDERLSRMPGGPEAIRHYYAAAPAVLAALGRGEGARHRLLSIYRTLVMPSAVCAALGLDRLAFRIYGRGMERLERELGLQAA